MCPAGLPAWRISPHDAYRAPALLCRLARFSGNFLDLVRNDAEKLRPPRSRKGAIFVERRFCVLARPGNVCLCCGAEFRADRLPGTGIDRPKEGGGAGHGYAGYQHDAFRRHLATLASVGMSIGIGVDSVHSNARAGLAPVRDRLMPPSTTTMVPVT